MEAFVMKMRIAVPLPLLVVVAGLASFGSANAQSERMCRRECVGAVCQERCVERRDETIGRGREEERETIIEERRDRRPDVELRVPLPVPVPPPNVKSKSGVRV